MGVAGMIKEVKLSCCKCHLRFFSTVANDEEIRTLTGVEDE